MLDAYIVPYRKPGHDLLSVVGTWALVGSSLSVCGGRWALCGRHQRFSVGGTGHIGVGSADTRLLFNDWLHLRNILLENLLFLHGLGDDVLPALCRGLDVPWRRLGGDCVLHIWHSTTKEIWIKLSKQNCQVILICFFSNKRPGEISPVKIFNPN